MSTRPGHSSPAESTDAANTFARTTRTTAKRHRERVAYDKADAFQVLDEALHCDLAFVGADGAPRVLPLFHARLGDTLYLHGSTGSSVGLGTRDTFPVSVTATIVDGLVFAKSWIHHSANYRSVVVHGEAVAVTDAHERRLAFRALVERMAAGRSERSREPDDKEDAATSLLAVELTEVSVKQRSGGASDDPADAGLPFRSGVAEVTTVVAGRY